MITDERKANMKTRWMREESQEPSDTEIRDEILRLLMMVDRDSTICPSEVARSLRPQWRQWMSLIRDVAAEMARENKIAVLQKGEPVDIETVRGPIRLKLIR
jgi:hypothetical protein